MVTRPERMSKRAPSEELDASADVRETRGPDVRVADERPPNWAELLVRFLDDGIRIPGTKQGIGLDAILGFFVPGVGDAITSAGSLGLFGLALKRRVPTVILLRMLLNQGIDTVVGSVPMLGDVFDVFYRSNRKNLELIERHQRGGGTKPAAADYLVVGVALMLAVASVVAPIVLAVFVGTSLWSLLSGD